MFRHEKYFYLNISFLPYSEHTQIRINISLNICTKWIQNIVRYLKPVETNKCIWFKLLSGCFYKSCKVVLILFYWNCFYIFCKMHCSWGFNHVWKFLAQMQQCSNLLQNQNAIRNGVCEIAGRSRIVQFIFVHTCCKYNRAWFSSGIWKGNAL